MDTSISEEQIQRIMGSRANVGEIRPPNLSVMIVDSDERSSFCDKVSGKIDKIRSGQDIVPVVTFIQHYFMSPPRPAYIPLSSAERIIERSDLVTVIYQKGSYSVHGT